VSYAPGCELLLLLLLLRSWKGVLPLNVHNGLQMASSSLPNPAMTLHHGQQQQQPADP
jgi:hypothetical protein